MVPGSKKGGLGDKFIFEGRKEGTPKETLYPLITFLSFLSKFPQLAFCQQRQMLSAGRVFPHGWNPGNVVKLLLL